MDRKARLIWIAVIAAVCIGFGSRSIFIGVGMLLMNLTIGFIGDEVLTQLECRHFD